MRLLLTFLIGLGSVCVAHSQPEPVAADTILPPGIEIVKLKWEKEVPLPALPFPDASSGPDNQTRVPTRMPRQPRPYYVYSMKLKNTGTQKIIAVAWEYFFLDPASKRALGRHKFPVFKKIKPNKDGTVKSYSRQPPTQVVTVAGLEKDKKAPFLEQAVIRCVLYDDGTQWKHPAAPETDCEFLRRAGQKKKK